MSEDKGEPLRCCWCQKHLPDSRPGEQNEGPATWVYCPHCGGSYSFRKPQRTEDKGEPDRLAEMAEEALDRWEAVMGETFRDDHYTTLREEIRAALQAVRDEERERLDALLSGLRQGLSALQSVVTRHAKLCLADKPHDHQCYRDVRAAIVLLQDAHDVAAIREGGED